MHYYNIGMGFSWFNFLFMIVFWIGFIYLIIWLITSLNKKQNTKSNAKDILKERFAKGEITKKEYLEKKEILDNNND